jgi:hypothetical protein
MDFSIVNNSNTHQSNAGLPGPYSTPLLTTAVPGGPAVELLEGMDRFEDIDTVSEELQSVMEL